MNNYIKLTAIMMLAFFVFACSNNDDNNINTKQEEKTSEEQDNTQDQSNIDHDAIVKYDFRKANWGMTKQEVKETEETEPKLETENTLDYSTYMLKSQFQIGYTFNNDELIRAGFFLLTKPESNDGYLELYQRVKDELVKVHGNPVIDTEQKLDPSKTFAPEEKADAVCNGDILYAAQWDLSNTDIQLVLRGENSECKLTILYLSEEGLRKLIQERMDTQ